MITVSSETLTVDGGNSRMVISPLGTSTLPAMANSSPFIEIFRSGATSSLAYGSTVTGNCDPLSARSTTSAWPQAMLPFRLPCPALPLFQPPFSSTLSPAMSA
ncbi:hypothetical protein D3C87_1581230 [compost metagenome]